MFLAAGGVVGGMGLWTGTLFVGQFLHRSFWQRSAQDPCLPVLGVACAIMAIVAIRRNNEPPTVTHG